MSAADHVRETIEPVVAPLGIVIEDVTVSPAGRRRVVRVLVDTDVAALEPADTTSVVEPLSLDCVADVSHAVSNALDAAAVLGEAPYVLEVSSPGVGRPLSTRDHFRRNVGRLVEVHHAGGQVTGRLIEVGKDALVLDVPATKKQRAQTVSVDLGDVRKGTVHVEFAQSAPAEAATDRASAPEEES